MRSVDLGSRLVELINFFATPMRQSLFVVDYRQAARPRSKASIDEGDEVDNRIYTLRGPRSVSIKGCLAEANVERASPFHAV